MKSSLIAIAIPVAAAIAVVGCSRDPPKLTTAQIDQLFQTQHAITQEQAALGRGRDALEEDRRRWAERSRRDPIIAMSLEGAASLIACSLPMFIVGILLATRRHIQDVDPAETLNVIEIMSGEPELFASYASPRGPASFPKEGT